MHLGPPHSIILYGRISITKYAFIRSLRVLGQFALGSQYLEPYVNSLTINLDGCRLPILLQHISSKLCADPRDYIYGILAFARGEYARKISVDYALSTRDVFKSGFYTYLEQNDSLDLLELVSLPSLTLEKPVICGLSTTSSFISADSTVHFTKLKGERISFAGISYFTVADVFELRSPMPQLIMELLRFYQTRLDSLREAHNDAVPGSEVALTLCAGFTSELCPKLTDVPSLENWQEFFTGTTSFSACAEGVLASIYPAAFLTLVNGQFGLGSCFIRRGDEMITSLGGRYCFAIRPKSCGMSTPIGTCFVPGMMTAELYLDPPPSNWAMEIGSARASSDRSSCYLYNKDTGRYLLEYPSLGKLPHGWEHRFERQLNGHNARCWRDTATGEEIYNDPRLQAEECNWKI